MADNKATTLDGSLQLYKTKHDKKIKAKTPKKSDGAINAP